MASLDRIGVRGYKSIRDAEVNLRSLNVLIGPNGAGKSNLVSVFELARNIVEQRLQAYIGRQGGANRLLHYGRQTTNRIGLDFSVNGGVNGYSCVLEPSATDSLFFASESCWFHNKAKYANPLVESLGQGHRETLLIERSRQTERVLVVDHVIRAMQSWRVYHFHDTSPSARVKATGDLNDNADLRDDASNLAAYLYMLEKLHPTDYANIVSAVRSVTPFFGGFDLRPDPLNNDKIRLEWRDGQSDMYFDASTLSDGTLRFMCLATLFLMPKLPDTIIVDEPELGLHPYAINVLAAMIRSAAARTQVIISTQSVTLVNQFGPDDIIVTDRVEGHSEFRRQGSAELSDWLNDYSLGELWEKNLLGGRPR